MANSAAVDPLDPVFDEAGREWNVDPHLLRAISRQESGGTRNPDRATSKAGAYGRMQIIPPTAKALGITDPDDPVQNIYGGAKYMSEALSAEKTPEDALRYYHGGPKWRNAYGPESKGYAPGVTAHYQRIVAAAPKDAPKEAPAMAKTAAAPAAEDDEIAAFLKRTGAKAAGAAAAAPAPDGEDDLVAAFLARTGAKKAAPEAVAPEPAAAPGESTARGYARNIAAGVTDAAAGVMNIAADPIGNLVGKPLATMGVFAHDALAPYLGYQRFPDDVRNQLLGDTVRQPGSAVVSGIGRAIGADPEAVEATPNEGLARKMTGAAGMMAVGPGGALMPAVGAGGAAAGDLAARQVPEWAKPAAELAGNVVGGAAVIPAGMAAGAGGRLAARGAEAVNRFGVGPDGPIPRPANPLIPEAPAGPSAGMGGPAPGSVGAAGNPGGIDTLAGRELRASSKTGDIQRLMRTPEKGDATEYVRGVVPTKAEIEQTATVSRREKMLRDEFREGFSDREKADNEKYHDHFDDRAGTPTMVNAAKEQRGETFKAEIEKAWEVKRPADLAPMKAHIADVLSGEDGRRAGIRKNVDSIMKEMVDADGNDITDPRLLYGVRKHIDDILDRSANPDSKVDERSRAVVLGMKDKLDEVIERAVPGGEGAPSPFRTALDNFAAASKPIDAMERLQDARLKLTNGSDRVITFGKVDKLLKDLVVERGMGGNQKAKSIDDDTMQAMFNLHASLQRSASSQELARVRGSDTHQRFMTWAKDAGLAGIHGAAQLAATTLGPVGHIAAPFIIKGATDALANRKARNLLREHMEPDMSKYQDRGP